MSAFEWWDLSISTCRLDLSISTCLLLEVMVIVPKVHSQYACAVLQLTY